MLALTFLRSHPDRVRDVMKARHCPISLDEVLALDRQVRTLQQKLEMARREHNALSQAMATLSPADREPRRAALHTARAAQAADEKQFVRLSAKLNELRLAIPNDVLPDVPLDPNPEHNAVLRETGTKPNFAFPPRDYLTIAEALDIIDVNRAGKVSGSRFGYLKGIAAELEFSLVQFTLATFRDRGFTAVIPPHMIRDEVIRGVGYLEGGGTLERYRLEKDHLYLIGTTEHTLVPMHMDETLPANTLPRRYLGFSPAYRREAGAYGKDTKGILRVHQFDQLEFVSFCLPEHDADEFARLLAAEEELLTRLGLAYRIVQLVSGDIPFPLAKTYDVETWLPGQGTYREIMSCSTATDFQARRLNIRYQRGRERGFVHTLNATALPIGRTLIAIIENYQTKEGFRIPDVLTPYLGGVREVKQP